MFLLGYPWVPSKIINNNWCEIFKVFEKKAETDQKYEETDQKYWESPQIYLNKIKGKWIYNSGKSIKKGGNSSKFEFRGISEKFEEIAETSQKNLLLGVSAYF